MLGSSPSEDHSHGCCWRRLRPFRCGVRRQIRKVPGNGDCPSEQRACEQKGRSLDLIIPEHLRASHWRGFEAAMTKGTTKLQGRPTLTRALHKSGRKIYVEMTFAIVKGGAEDEVLGSVAMARDVTDRIERERAATRAS